MSQTASSIHEIVAQGEALYQARIRHQVETPENIGREIVIDIDSGDYEIDADGMAADRRLRSRRPHARFYGARIGYDAVYAIGGVLKRTAGS